MLEIYSTYIETVNKTDMKMTISKQALTKLQEVFFDLSDLLDSRELRGMRIKCLEEFDTMEDFLKEQIESWRWLKTHLNWSAKMTTKKLSIEEIESLAEDALNAACLLIQNHIGQTDGGNASIWFSDDVVLNNLKAYIKYEQIECGEE